MSNALWKTMIGGAAALLLACSSPSDPAPSGGNGGSGGEGTGGGAGASSTIGAQSFGGFAPWATPIEDYLAAGFEELGHWNFLRGIHDLSVYRDRLYLGYGDANENLCRVIPIGLRFFSASDEPTATNEFDTDEEHVERYRQIGEDLYVAGIDATEDAWLGNIYFRRPDKDWVKSRTLSGGVHVHDVAGFDGAHWAVGSGSQEPEWNKGDIYAHLWRSGDGGESFDIAERVHNGGNGDARWVRMLPLGDQLYLFGYTSDASYKIDALIGARYDGKTLEMLPDNHPLRWVFATETDRVGEQGLVRGVNLSNDPLLHAIWLIDADGTVTPVDGLAGKTVVDLAYHAPTQETVLLTNDGDDYAASFELTQWQVRVLVTSDFKTFTELLAFQSDIPPKSIVYWESYLFYGTDHGAVMRSTQVP